MGFTLELRITGDANSAEAAVQALAGKLHDLSDANQEVGKSGQAATDPLEALAGVAGSLGVAFSVAAGVDLAGKLFMLGVEAQRATFALNAMTGGRADEWMVDMTAATQGLIDDEAAAGVAANMLALGIAKSKDEAVDMIRVSTILGAAFGNMGAEEAADAFVTMTSRMSTRQLKEFGLSTAKVKDKVAELMAANGDLTEQQAFVNAVMELGSKEAEQQAGILNDSKSKVTRLDTAWGNFQETIGGGLENLGIPLIELATEALQGIQTETDATSTRLAQQQRDLLASTNSFEEYSRAAQETDFALSVTREQYNKLRNEQVLLTAETYTLVEATRADRDARGANIDTVNDAIAKTQDLAQKLNDATIAYEGFAGRQLNTLANIDQIASGTGGLAGIFEFTTSKLKEYDLTNAETLKLYEQMGLVTGQVTEKQIAQSQAFTQLVDGLAAGKIRAEEYTAAVQAIQAGEDAASVVNATFRKSIEETATSLGLSGRAWQNYVNTQMAALKESDPSTIEGLRAKVDELNAVIANMTQPEKIMFESTAGDAKQEIDDLIAATEKYGTMPPQRVETLVPSAPASAEQVGGLFDQLTGLAALSPVSVDIIMNQIGSVPGVPGTAQNASGTPYSPGGLTLVGEQGPELVMMPRGAEVKDASATRALLREDGGASETININAPMTFIVNNEQSLQAIMKSTVKK